ncbi:hypothetical protein Pcinc_020329 [Petrolisthes cinctipes]|uniref:Uncharacterized protein n=1 Tax=Petrolisthes cinctipes TaxID=88211 RepID=A0AAE1FIC9_PETCI|nr:hypothetical protein Pcinc_020329 [Petrolisthes cinctipes]
MGISDKEAFRILGLPLGVDKDAINERYKSLCCKLSSSKTPTDKKKLEEVVAAYGQLLPLPAQRNTYTRNKGKSNSTVHNDTDSDASSEEDWRVLCRNGRGATHQQHQQLSDAEKERRKAEKRREKKKRRNERKKLEKIENRIFNQNADDNKKGEDSESDEEEEDDNEREEEEEEETEEEEEEEQGLDPSSAFFAKAAKSMKVNVSGKQEKQSGKVNKQETGKQEVNGVAGTVLQARQLAMRGNEAANVGQYSAAVRLFSDAIRLHPHDHRFFGNRSYCRHQLSHYEKALSDAEKAIKLAPHWPKGHFRRGTSLHGLGQYIEAESAFEEVLRLDPGCQEAGEEIKRVRVTRIVEMGFTTRQAGSAIAKYTHVQPALDALLSGEFRKGLGEVFYSDDEDGFGLGDEDGLNKRGRLVAQPVAANNNVKMNPKNPDGLTSLWVGNVLPEVSEKRLSHLFAKQGPVSSVRLLKDKYCAFVNYQDKVAAGRAMERLQGYELAGQRLLIKFPDNPIATLYPAAPRKPKPMQNGTKNTSVGKSNGSATAAASTAIPSSKSSPPGQPSQTNGSKLRGPVNGDECYFWRTTGCAFGDACKHKHLPRNKAIDRKPWQK